MLLDAEHEPGTPLADVLPLVDTVLEIETGYNRPDLTSVYGIARDVAALLDLSLAAMPGVQDSGPVPNDEPVDVRIDDFERCPRYIGRLFRDVRVSDSPPWLKARLLGAGMRPISNVVDVTNYVMLALGSPLHAFDHAKLAEGRIVVRRAGEGESIRTLDGSERALTSEELVIADAERPVAVAGIMGGEETEVSAETRTVLLEAANFEQLGVLQSGERLHMRSESQTRWEKGVAPELAEPAANHATELIVQLAGARWTGHTDVKADVPERPVIRLRTERAEEVVGIPIAETEQRERLTRLGFDVDEKWNVRTPYWRARDVRREIDLVEEVARFHLEEVPPTLPTRRELFGRLTLEQRLRRQVADVLVGCGFFEAYTYSLQADDPHPDALALPEPLSELQRVLRTTLLYGLIGAARHNVNAGTEDVALFEIAHVYLPTGEALPDEPWRLGGIVRGDFYRAKGAVEQVFSALKLEPRLCPRSASLHAVARIGQRGRGLGRAARPAPARRRVGGVRARPRRAVRARARAGALPRRDHLPPGAPGPCVQRPRGSPSRRPRRRGARGRRRGAARDARVRRLPRRTGRGGPEVGRVLGRVPVGGAHPLRRGRGEAPRCDRRRPGTAVRRRAPRLRSRKPICDIRGTLFPMLRHGVLFALVLAVVAALGGRAAADNPVLQARVGENDSFAITLTDATGAKVTHLDPGDYTIHVNDLSDMHNFDLTGPGVSKSTGVTDIGEQTWNVTFTNGTYKFVCDVHVTSMKGQFTVGVVPTVTPTQNLSGGVGPGAHISLTRSARAGKAVLTIRDRSKKDNLHLTGPGVNKKTGVAFTGTVKWTVTLKAGTYTFRSDAHRALKGTLKVS